MERKKVTFFIAIFVKNHLLKKKQEIRNGDYLLAVRK